MTRLSRAFQQFFEPLRNDVYKFCEAMNFTPSWQQRQLLDLVQSGCCKIAVKSGQGPGKTTISAIVGLWRTLRTFGAMTVLTAPTMRQCKDVWLAECGRLMEKADPFLKRLIEVTKSKIIVGGHQSWGVKLVTATKSENAQGLHQENMTIICEEASGIPRDIIEQFEGTLSNVDGLMIQIGNPNTRDCAFFDCFHMNRHEWATLTFNAEEAPAHIVNPERNDYLARVYGKDSDVYRIRVLGEFPHTDPNCVIPSECLERCVEVPTAVAMRMPEMYGEQKVARQFGIDFARFGGDQSVIYRRIGGAVVAGAHFNHTDPSEVCNRAFHQQLAAGWHNEDCAYVADGDGMGQGVMSRFYDQGKRVLEFRSQAKAYYTNEYDNRITEAYFLFARLAKEGRIKIPNDPRLIQQLSSRQYFTTAKGKLILEKKDDFLKRMPESPDRGDAMVMCFYPAAGIANSVYQVKHRSKSVGV